MKHLQLKSKVHSVSSSTPCQLHFKQYLWPVLWTWLWSSSLKCELNRFFALELTKLTVRGSRDISNKSLSLPREAFCNQNHSSLPHPIPTSFFPPQSGCDSAASFAYGTECTLTHTRARFPFHWFQWWLWALCVKMTSWQKDLHFCLIHKRLQTTDKPQVLQLLQLSGARAKWLSMENWKQLWYNKVNQTKTFLLMQPLSTKFNCST